MWDGRLGSSPQRHLSEVPITTTFEFPMKVSRLVYAGFLSIAVLGLYLHAQIAMARDDSAKPPSESAILFTMSAPVDEVRLNFTVTDKGGNFIKGLSSDDFRLFDNESPPERMIRFQAHVDSPMSVVMLFDISSSIRYRFEFEQKAANHFLKHVLRPGIDRAAIISFGSDVHEVQSMTGDINLLTSAVSHLKPGGDTALHDAVIRAAKDLSSQPPDTRKIIIILSDGADTISHAGSKDCMVAAISSEATIIVVDASVPSESNSPGQRFLRKVAENSGGFVLPARLDSELKTSFNTINSVLRNQYSLTYKPSLFQRDGDFRAVELTTRKTGMIVHSRNGYYAKRD
jgi:Ca-activated chloride channel homolog